MTKHMMHVHRVYEGMRPQRPSDCPDSIFTIMEQCWKQRAVERPMFSRLKMDIQDAYAAEIAAQAAQERDEQSLCVICLDKQATFALYPCGHKCVCEADASLISRQGTCPVCRTPVQSELRIW